MERKEFRTSIQAAPKKVWDTLWGDTTYPIWTAVFAEGSKAITDWNEGSKVLFVNGDGEGMVSVIAEKKEPVFMSFKHIGMRDRNGNEETESEQVKTWAGAMENYSLKYDNGKTELLIEMDIDEGHMDYFLKTWPQALEKLKELAEEPSK